MNTPCQRSPSIIDSGRHPLSSGFPPDWADGWGQDEHGVFAELILDDAEIRLRWIPPGQFVIGSPADEAGRWHGEGPQTDITIADGFWLMDAPVTQALWQSVMDRNPAALSRRTGLSRTCPGATRKSSSRR